MPALFARSACGKETPCIGYVAVEGYRNINVRLMAIQGEIDFMAIDAACQPIDLWPSFQDMLEAYEDAYAVRPAHLYRARKAKKREQ